MTRIRVSRHPFLSQVRTDVEGECTALREHALFSIRNILKDNVQNQEVISKATTYRVGETGEFYDLPPAMRT